MNGETVTKYRTICADPPWDYPEGFAIRGPRIPNAGRERTGDWERHALPYPSMSVEELAALPVPSLAEQDCRMFLWTTNRYLPASFGLLDAWGFVYRQTLVWHKTHVNMPASVAPNSAEFVLVATTGRPKRENTMPSAVISAGIGGRTSHSTKPELWMDYFEQVSPGPYLEMFARRTRLGWDTWGLECLNHVALGEEGNYLTGGYRDDKE